MATLTQFRSELEAVLGLDEDLPSELAMMDFYINEGVTDVLLRTHCAVRPFTMTTTADKRNYTLPLPILVMIELVDDGNRALVRVTHAEMYKLRRSSSSSSVRSYSVVGANVLMLYPTPTTEESLSGIYVPRPPTLVNGEDSPSSIPSEWHKAISFYAMARAADMDDDSTSEQGERYRGLYEGAIQEIRRGVYRHGGSRMAPARVSRRRRLLVTDNSADV